MKRFLTTSISFCLLMAAFATVAFAFFDEIDVLRNELAAWETVNESSDFTDILAQLEDMTGTVFTDVHEDDWFHVFVAALEDWDIISGYRDTKGKLTGEYKPSNSVTIAEVLKMSLNAADTNIETCSEPSFHPEAEGHWAKQYVACGEEMGMRVLSSQYLAALNRPATRAEVITMMHDAFHDSVPPIYSQFSDTSGHLFESDIAYASLLGIVTGDQDENGSQLGTFRPDDAINRAEVSKIVYETMKEAAKDEVL